MKFRARVPCKLRARFLRPGLALPQRGSYRPVPLPLQLLRQHYQSRPGEWDLDDEEEDEEDGGEGGAGGDPAAAAAAASAMATVDSILRAAGAAGGAGGHLGLGGRSLGGDVREGGPLGTSVAAAAAAAGMLADGSGAMGMQQGLKRAVSVPFDVRTRKRLRPKLR